MFVRSGIRLRSAACGTEVIVIRGKDEVDLRCGGAPMVPADQAVTDRLPLDPGFGGGTALGKRYGDAGGSVELLCVKPGEGSLSIGTTPLELQGAKPLPASD